MVTNTRNEKLEQLAGEIARLTGESRTVAIVRALEERKERITMNRPEKRTLAEVLDFLEKEVWANIPRERLGRQISKKERERILGYGRGGV